VRGHGGGRSSRRGGMSRVLLAAAALVVLAAAGVASGAGATWDVYPGEGALIQDATCAAGGYDLCACGSECS